MNRIEAEAHDSLVAFEERRKRHAKGYPPQPRTFPASTWAPKLTEQQQIEQEQYIKEHNLPF